jgi:hypothetical protein
VKGVSDRANEDGQAAIIRNLPSVCDALAGTVAAGLSDRNACPIPETREPLAKPCFASGVFRCQVSGVRMGVYQLSKYCTR